MGAMTEARPAEKARSGAPMKMSRKDALRLIQQARKRGAKVEARNKGGPATTLEKPGGGVQKKAGCALCAMAGGTPETAPKGYSCPLCKGGGASSGAALEKPRDSMQMKGAGTRDAAEVQADAIGAQIGAALGGHSVSAGPLSAGVRQVAEGYLGVSLAGTELRSDAGAHASTASVGALAMAEGSTVSFGKGQLARSEAGRALVGHELTHVAQQRAHGTTARQGFFGLGDDEGSGGIEAGLGAPVSTSPPDGRSYEVGGEVSLGGITLAGEVAFTVGPDGIALAGDAGITIQVGGQEYGGGFGGGVGFGGVVQVGWPGKGDMDDFERKCPDGTMVRATKPCPPVTKAHVQPSGTCGPDLTPALKAFVDKIPVEFPAQIKHNVQGISKFDVCQAIVNPNPNVSGTAWDISELGPGLRDSFMAEIRAAAGCPGACRFSIRIGSDCWNISAVNYVLLGHACRECGFPRGVISVLVGLWGSVRGKEMVQAGESQAWAEAGFDKRFATGGSSKLSKCSGGCPPLPQQPSLTGFLGQSPDDIGIFLFRSGSPRGFWSDARCGLPHWRASR